jgi:hypothetical protein
MAYIYESTVVSGVWIVEPAIHGDQRGMFIETYRREWFPHGREMIQGNRANRQQGALVGLHYHLHQADYWYVPFGHARVVLHDLREGGPTDGATLELDLTGDNHHGVFIPPGVALLQPGRRTGRDVERPGGGRRLGGHRPHPVRARPGQPLTSGHPCRAPPLLADEDLT